MRRILTFAPIAALALSVLAISPASAQVPPRTDDPALVGQLVQLRAEARTSHREYDRVIHAIYRCQAPDESERLHAMATANELAQHAGALALQLPGRQHAEAMRVLNVAETDFWMLAYPQTPDACYQPPAE